jgi:hypothetical protein
LIRAARDSGQPAVKIQPVVLSASKTLHFEVRFGLNAKSSRMPGGSPTGICQVNLDGTENTRVVEEVAPPPAHPRPCPISMWWSGVSTRSRSSWMISPPRMIS